ncbi:HD family hydrolase [Natronomonas pharaonis DSM 2160]|uniref:HD family hydrolase n=1 Tax=Natronomonas pharaonis (strain ATCC 35678 / DSM 2160 / CIP 103997 / JCM 8858 / NBRC 14720 / NCIMB 2260 / Gabara) TaxID=348780 RepID=A0A1U7EV73_NATPD|nr:HD domain-containing protein [Natronomonas pharaonis]CAI48909.1 HD family hydrolase [Natronomonas pharaonis DSM 2160]
MGVEIRESPVSDEEFEEMKRFVRDYLAASVESEDEGGRMRWYPWHSAEYRFNHILNVTELASKIAAEEGANVDVTRVAALFHDIAKLEAEQDVHAEAGARVAREYLRSRTDYPESFIDQVCAAVADHSYEGDLDTMPLETQCLMEADLLDKVGANGTMLMLLRMGYEARTHMDANEMVGRVLERGEDAIARVRSDTAQSIAHQRIKRVRWFKEWLEGEVAGMDPEDGAAAEL